MTYGICELSLVPLREAGQHSSLLVSEILYGELFQILSQQKKWSRARLLDSCEGWIENSQYKEISKEVYNDLKNANTKVLIDLVEFVYQDEHILFPISIGSIVQNSAFLGHHFEGNASLGVIEKSKIRENAFMFLNTPYRQGGKSPFGIDASGFVQLVYRLCGILLPRTPKEQSEKGETLSFIEESEVGDLAFFDDNEGNIIHVGIVLENNHIIHAHGKVRMDRLDQTGIYNVEMRKHTHKLRLIKTIS